METEKKLSTGERLLAQSREYKRSADRVMSHAGLKSEAALTETELATLREVLSKLNVVQSLYNGDVDKALEDAPGYGERFRAYDLDSGSMYGVGKAYVEYRVDEAGNVTGLSAWATCETRDLLNAILKKQSNKGCDALNEALAAAHGEDGFSLEDTLAVMEELKASGTANLVPNEDYLGHGYIGPYKGSTEFAGDDGFEFIYLEDGAMLVRVGRGYATLDTEEWEYYVGHAGDPDSFVLDITQGPSEQAGDILMAGNATGGSGDLVEAARQFEILNEAKELLAGNIEGDEPSSDLLDMIANRDKAFREEQGQQNLFPEKGASKKTASDFEEGSETIVCDNCGEEYDRHVGDLCPRCGHDNQEQYEEKYGSKGASKVAAFGPFTSEQEGAGLTCPGCGGKVDEEGEGIGEDESGYQMPNTVFTGGRCQDCGEVVTRKKPHVMKGV